MRPVFQRGRVRHPLHSIAFQSMLSYLASGEGTFRPRAEENSVTLSEPLPCTGKLHSDADKFGRLRFQKATGRYVTTCTCGVSMSVGVDSNGKICHLRAVKFGPRYKAKFRELVAGGMNPTAAGRKIGIKHCAARNWKQRDLPGRSELSKSCRAGLRAKWRACVESSPTERRLTNARKREPNVWLKLHIYDNAWLKRFNAGYMVSKRCNGARLIEICTALDDAYKVIGARVPPERITKKALVAVGRAGLDGRSLGLLNVAAKQHMSALVEGRSMFVDRLIGYWFETLAGERVASISQFSARSGLALKRLTAAQRARIGNWFAGSSR